MQFSPATQPLRLAVRWSRRTMKVVMDCSCGPCDYAAATADGSDAERRM